MAAAYALLPASAAPSHPASARVAIRYTTAAQTNDKAMITRARLAAQPTSYTARRGDTLSEIARAQYGSARLWPALWWANRHEIRNPNALAAGTTLQLSAWHPDKAWVAARALAAIPKPPEPRPVQAPATRLASGSSPPADGSAAPAPAPVIQAATPAQAVTGGSGFEACVIQAESGGNAVAQNPTSTASGLYGFLDTTWTAVTGLPGPARAYPPAQQQAAFQKLYAQAGTAPWAAYDGC